MKIIYTKHAPKPAGHYAQGIVHNGMLFISGQLPVEPKTGEKILGSIEEQTSRCIQNVKAITEAAGSSLDHILKTTVYIADISLWDRVNQVYAKHFGDHQPARAVVPTKELHFGFQIEIEAIAAITQEEYDDTSN